MASRSSAWPTSYETESGHWAVTYPMGEMKCLYEFHDTLWKQYPILCINKNSDTPTFKPKKHYTSTNDSKKHGQRRSRSH